MLWVKSAKVVGLATLVLTILICPIQPFKIQNLVKIVANMVKIVVKMAKIAVKIVVKMAIPTLIITPIAPFSARAKPTSITNYSTPKMNAKMTKIVVRMVKKRKVLPQQRPRQHRLRHSYPLKHPQHLNSAPSIATPLVAQPPINSILTLHQVIMSVWTKCWVKSPKIMQNLAKMVKIMAKMITIQFLLITSYPSPHNQPPPTPFPNSNVPQPSPKSVGSGSHYNVIGVRVALGVMGAGVGVVVGLGWSNYLPCYPKSPHYYKNNPSPSAHSN